MNYYERHLGDYARDTAHLTMLEHGAYGMLLDRYYSTEAPIPADQAHRLARARTREERAAVDAVLSEFFVLRDGLWSNRRAEEEIARAQVKIDAARTNGSRGGRPKKNPAETKEKPSGFSVGSENITQAKAHQTPDTRHQEQERAENSTTAARASGASPTEVNGALPTPAGAVCLAMRAAGLAAVNPGDPRLLELLRQGATEAEFVGIAGEAAGKGRGWAWVLAVVERRRADAAAIALAPAVTTPWHDSRSGVEAKGEELGLGRWDEAAFNASISSHESSARSYQAYQARVFKAAGHVERSAA